MNTNNTIAMNHLMTFDLSTTRSIKPTPKQVGSISKNLTSKKEVNISEFATMMAPNGYTFCPAIFNGSRSNKNWLSQSVFCLDFDSGITHEAVISRLSDLNIKVNVVYTSFSDSPLKRKFRACIFLDSVITDKVIAKFIMINLMNIFKDEVDKSTKDYARLFYSGKEVLHIDNVENNTNDLLNVLNTIQIAADNGQTRKIQKLQNNPISYSVYIEDVVIEQKMDSFKILKNYDFDIAKEEVRIFADFCAGKWLTHGELFGLASNLLWIEGGILKMKNTMNKWNNAGKTQYNANNFAILPYVSKVKYAPQRLENFSPYTSDHQHLNLLTVERFSLGRVDIVEAPKLISLTEAEDKMELQLNKFILETKDTDGERIMLAKTACALGKTQHLTTLKGVVIACENNKLKNELATRMQHKHFMVTPDFPTFTTEAFNIVLKSYYDSNLGEYASKFVRKIAHNKTSVTIDGKMITINEDDKDIALIYIAENELVSSCSMTIITTHTRALSSEFPNHDLIIFDEDPLNSIMEIGSLSLDFNVFDGSKFKKDVKAVSSYFNSLTTQVINDTKTLVFTEDYHEFCITAAALGKGSLIKALHSKWVMKTSREIKIQGAASVEVYDIKYSVVKDLPKEKNILILSATAPEGIYLKMNSELEFLNLSLIEQQGQIIQNTRRSYSRSGMKSYSNNVKTSLLQSIGDQPVLTFKTCKAMFPTAMTDIHFGKCSGADEFKGIDITVVGTDNKPTEVYFFYAKMLGININTSDNMLEYQKITWKGMTFKFMTYDNKDLRDIQLSLIESNAIQAVGRGRSLRTDAIVTLYSNLPLQIATSIINN